MGVSNKWGDLTAIFCAERTEEAVAFYLGCWELLAHHEKEIKIVIGKKLGVEYGNEDADDCYCGFIKSCLTGIVLNYNPAKKASFRTYFYVSLTNFCITYKKEHPPRPVVVGT